MAMIDGNNTSPEWQTHTGEICVLPVGSFEQHGHHLPLCTDILGAERFARMAAEELDAALLPALPFGTCMEHTGFRGSISLRPETLMQTVRDIADEVERQQFRVLIIVNGHGGNFVLGPVARDINRADRALKIIFLNWWELRDASIAVGGERGPDFHAGEMETSLMMAVRPDLMREEKIDAPVRGPEFALSQPDLNIFGMGHFAESGAVGYPTLATAEKGEAILNSVRKLIKPYLSERLRRLQEQPKYSGRGGIAIRRLTQHDLAAAIRLKELARWNQTEDDWNFFLENHSDGCFAAVQDGRMVGTTTVAHYSDALAWIGMVLVDPQFRRMGIGKRLLEHAIESTLDSEVIGLDATPLGKELYDRLDFNDEYSLQRWTHPCLPPSAAPLSDKARLLKENDWPQLLAFDLRVFGADRSRLLRSMSESTPASAWCLWNGEQLAGFCCGRRGSNFHQIGPLVAEDFDAAQHLLRSVQSTLAGKAVGLDVADAQTEMTAWLRELGFSAQRPFIRMTRGKKSVPGVLSQQFAIAGPEFG